MRKNNKGKYFKRNKKDDVKNRISRKDKNSTGDFLSLDFEILPEEYKRKKDLLTSFFLDEKYSPATVKQIKDIFGIKNSEVKVLFKILSELIEDGNIYLDTDNKYKSIKNSELYICEYDGKSKQFGFGIFDDKYNIKEDVYIPKALSLNAMDKDKILVKIIDGTSYSSSKMNGKKVGQVIKIMKRNTKTVIGRYIKSKNFGFVEPINTKIDDIYISKKNDMKVKDGSFVKVEILRYQTENNKSEGKVIDLIGSEKDQNIEIKALYESYELDQKRNFSKQVLKELESIPEFVLDEEKKGRVDKTKERIYTIDSEDSMDLDDAVFVKKQGDKYVLSVCIADVSHYVKNQTELDKEAISRATSIYIPGSVIPMLPKKLSNGICSLNAGVERLSLGIDIIIDENGNVVDNNIYKAVIKVTKKMSYEKVYKVILGQDRQVLTEYKDYVDDIFLMKELALILKNKRIRDGSIDFDIPETKVVLDNSGNVVDIKPYEINIANNIVEEFMLIANMQIAEKFYFLKAPFIYRIHEKPDEEKLRDLNEVLSNYKIRIKSFKNIHTKTLSDILKSFEDEESKSVISKLMLRTLKLAKYSDQCIGHFGLAAKYYCHFTSPIRRYPDLFIHRVISDYIDNNYVLQDKKDGMYRKQAEKYSIISSEMEKHSTIIERDFDDLYKAIFMKDKIGSIYDGIVSSITQFGMFIKLENTVEGLIPFETMDDYYIFDDKNFRLIGRENKKVYKIGDRLRVKVIRVDIQSKQIDFSIVKG